MAAKLRKELTGVKITSVTSPATIQRIAKEHDINPQEVFVRVGFEYQDEEYSSSNQLRFFGQEGYEKLLAAKVSGELVDITVTSNDKGTLMYLNNNEQVSIADLFSTPVAKTDNRKKLEDLF